MNIKIFLLAALKKVSVFLYVKCISEYFEKTMEHFFYRVVELKSSSIQSFRRVRDLLYFEVFHHSRICRKEEMKPGVYCDSLGESSQSRTTSHRHIWDYNSHDVMEIINFKGIRHRTEKNNF